MQTSLLRRHWPQAPDLDDEARHTMVWLCDRLDEARLHRQAQEADRGQPDGPAESSSNVIAFPVRRDVRVVIQPNHRV